MTITYTYLCSHTGNTYRVKIEGVARFQDEPYPPGGFLRVCYNKAGQQIAGPLVSEILSWEVA